MNNGLVLFETEVMMKSGMPYLASKKKTSFLITMNEMRFVDPLWVFTIPMQNIIRCEAKAMLEKKMIAATFTAPSMVEIMNNFLCIDYLDAFNQKTTLQAIFCKHLMIKKNVAESIRFTETIKKYNLQSKFISESSSSN